ncbi:MAG: glycosyltransferase [Acidimicrobiales bacterium]
MAVAVDRAPNLQGEPVADCDPQASPRRARRVALVHLGNKGALGTTRRVEVWRELLGALDCHLVEIDLLASHRRRIPSPAAAFMALRGTVVPESVTWSWKGVRKALDAFGPDATIFVTPRAFHPGLANCAPISLLDVQDRFSQSYRGRGAVDRRPGAWIAWRLLAALTERFERRDHRVRLVAAGFSEAKAMGARWVPNLVVPAPEDDRTKVEAFDVTFFGKLSALPNLDALRRLSEIWPSLEARRPGTTCLIAGSGVTAEVRSLADRHGWTLENGFTDVFSLAQRSRIAVAPLRRANGIQNKVLEAAAAGLAQVVTEQSLLGTAPGFPALVARNDEELVEAIDLLLKDDELRERLAATALHHVNTRYALERWTPVVEDILTPAPRPRVDRPLDGCPR